jgi:hypothetical protein
VGARLSQVDRSLQQTNELFERTLHTVKVGAEIAPK